MNDKKSRLRKVWEALSPLLWLFLGLLGTIMYSIFGDDGN